MKKSELRNIIREEIQSVLNEGFSWADEKRQQDRDDTAYKKDHQKFKDRERNAGLNEPDTIDYKKMAGQYVKVGKSYIPLQYHSPGMGKTDGKIYLRNKKTGGYFPKK